MYSMTLVPLFLCTGAITFWLITRELAALVMALGLLPTFASLTQYWWGAASYIEQENGLIVPDDSYMELAQTFGTAVSAGTTISAVAFVALAWRMRSYVKAST